MDQLDRLNQFGINLNGDYHIGNTPYRYVDSLNAHCVNIINYVCALKTNDHSDPVSLGYLDREYSNLREFFKILLVEKNRWPAFGHNNQQDSQARKIK